MVLPNPPGRQVPGFRLTRGSAVRSEPVEWLRPGVPIGNTTLLAGPPGLAKTTLVCEWAARVSRGQMPGAFLGRPADVIILSGEDAIANTLRPRTEAAGADLDRIWFVEFGMDDFVIPDDLDHLAALVAKVPTPVMVALDPLMAFVSDRIDSHKDHHARRAFKALFSFGSECRLAMVVVAHLNKNESRDFLNQVNASVGIGAAVRSAWGVVEHPQDPGHRVLVHTKSNLGPYQPSHRFRIEGRTTLAHDGRPIDTSGIVWLGEDPTVTRSNVLEVTDPEERTKREEAADWLGAWLADGPQPSVETLKAAKANGIAERTLMRAKAEIGVESTPVYQAGGRGAQGWTWSLPLLTPDLDGHGEYVPGGNLNTAGESAGQKGSGGTLSHLDGHLARARISDHVEPHGSDEEEYVRVV